MDDESDWYDDEDDFDPWQAGLPNYPYQQRPKDGD